METKNRKIKKSTTKSFLKRVKWRFVILSVVIVSIVAVTSMGAYFAWNVYQETADFDAKKLDSKEPSKVYDINGNLIYTVGDDVNGKRENVSYDDLPQVLVDAVVAGEDSRFFEHDGFDLPRIVKAAFTNLAKGRIAGGGSTITQQLMKKAYFPKEEQTFERKLGEIFLAMEATKEVSKEEILEKYLNKIYFGRGGSSIGIAAASRYYFNKEVSYLTLPEAALLAGTLNMPDKYDPYYNLAGATERRDTVLKLMFDHGYISEDEMNDAKAVKIENMLQYNTENANIKYQSYIKLVLEEVKKVTGDDPKEVSMDIHTFLNPEMQDELDEYTAEYSKYKDDYIQVGASVQSNKDGRIVGIIGGRNQESTDTYFGNNYADMKRQPGSALKPVTDYGAAFEFLGWSTGGPAWDKPYSKAGYAPSNHNGSTGSNKPMDIAEALLNSWNMPAVWAFDFVINKVGANRILQMYEDFGVDMEAEKDRNGNAVFDVAFGLGGWTEGTTPIEMANIYSTVSNGGMHYKSHTINTIQYIGTDKVVNVDQDIQNTANRAITEQTSFMIREVMGDYIERFGRGKFVAAEGRAKTGTTNYPTTGADTPSYLRGRNKDNWLIAYNPDYSTAVWMGYDIKTVKDYHEETGKVLEVGYGDAREFCEGVYKILANKGLKNSYPDRPSGLYQAKMVKGEFPYKSPSSSTPSNMIVNAWFQENGLGIDGEDTSASINDLTSFDATLTANNQISVTFAAYDPADATTSRNATEGTKKYGLIVYGVEVSDAATGAHLYSTTLSSPSGTLDFTPTSAVVVSGYYTYKDNSSIRSNVLSKTIGATNQEEQTSDLAPPNVSLSVNGETIGTSITMPANTQFSLTVSVVKQDPNSTVNISVSGTNFSIGPGQTSTTIPLTSGPTSGATFNFSFTETVNGKTSPASTMSVVVNHS